MPDQAELVRRLRSITSAMGAQLSRQVKLNRKRLEVLATPRPLQSPTAYVDERRLLLDGVQRRLCTAQQQTLAGSRQRCVRLAAALDAMSPLKVLGRGYAVARSRDGTILKSGREVVPGDRVSVTLSEGGFDAVVERSYMKEDQT